MTDKTKERIKQIIVGVAGVCSAVGLVWGIGRIVIHDIPTMIRGYDYVAIETDYVEDDMGTSHEVVTKKAKRKVTFSNAVSELVTNFVILSISAGFFVTVPSYKGELNKTKGKNDETQL